MTKKRYTLSVQVDEADADQSLVVYLLHALGENLGDRISISVCPFREDENIYHEEDIKLLILNDEPCDLT